MTAESITRYGVTSRWADAVVHRGTVYFVEVPDDPMREPAAQFQQVLNQVDLRLAQVGSGRDRLLQVLIYLPNPQDVGTFNPIWENWLPAGHAPTRACVHAALAAPGYCVELVVTAACDE